MPKPKPKRDTQEWINTLPLHLRPDPWHKQPLKVKQKEFFDSYGYRYKSNNHKGLEYLKYRDLTYNETIHPSGTNYKYTLSTEGLDIKSLMNLFDKNNPIPKNVSVLDKTNHYSKYDIPEFIEKNEKIDMDIYGYKRDYYNKQKQKPKTVDEYNNRQWKRVLDLEPDKDGYIDYEYVKYADKKKGLIKWIEQYYKITRNEAEKIWKKFIKYCNDTKKCSKPDVNYYSLSDAQRNISQQGISNQISIFVNKYMKDKPKPKKKTTKQIKKIDSTLISDDITKAVKNITKSAISDYKKSKPKKERKTSNSPWIQHVYNYEYEHNIPYKVAVKEAKASYEKIDNKYVSKKKEKVLVENTFTFEEQRKFYTKANAGGQLNGRDILNSLSNTYINSRDSSDTIRNKLIKYSASLKGMKRRLDFYRGKNEEANILLEIIHSESKKISDLYSSGKNVGWTSKGSTKTGIKREKKPKASIIPVEQQLINILKDNLNIDIRLDNIKELKKDGDNYTLLLQNVNLDNENILGIKFTWDTAGYQIQIFKLFHNEKYNRDMTMLHKKEFVYTNQVKDNN